MLDSCCDRQTIIPHYLNPSEAAIYAGISTRTLQKYRDEGSGPAFIKISRRKVLYNVNDLNDWMQTRRCTSVGLSQ